MKNYNICIKTALAVFAVALSACSSDDDIADNNSNSQEKPVTNKTMTFRATMDDGSGSNSKATRTDFNGNNTIWAANDKIYILNKADVDEEHPAGGEFTIGEPADGSNYGKEENFSGDKIKANGSDNDQFYAYYPSSSFDTDNEVMTGNIPTVQTPTDGTYPQTLHYMTAYSTNSTFKFKNVCALLKITLTNNTTISRIKVVANPTLTNLYDQQFNYTNIAGGFTATIGSDGTATTTATGTKNTYVELHAAGDNTAKTSLGNGTFYMVVLPAAINGFTLILEDKDENVYQRVNTSRTAFARNEMYNLGSYDCTSATTLLNSGLTSFGNDVVDLDLPSGTLWAKKNLNSKNGLLSDPVILGFTSSETDYGGYFSFGKESVWAMGGYATSKPGLDESTLKNAYDPAYSYASFNQKYCMPIYAQLYEFYNHFSNDYKQSFISRTLGFATNGYAIFTAPTGTGRTITMPYTGHYMGAGALKNEHTHMSYWSRTAQDQGANLNPLDWASSYCLETEEKTVNGKKVPEQVNAGGGSNAWVDDAYTGRAIRPVATNIKIAPIK